MNHSPRLRTFVFGFFIATASPSTPVLTTAIQDQPIVLSPGDSHRVPDTNLTVIFEAVVEDSRCPVGTTCIWAGDAVVRLRVESAGAKPATYLLHTNDQSAQEVAHDGVLLRLSSLIPEPTAGGRPRPEDYRATLNIRRNKQNKRAVQ